MTATSRVRREVNEMQDAELFMALAEIAGVFVGFGALIAVRGAGHEDPVDVAYVRMIVWMAVAVIIVALAPVVMERFGATGHTVWLPCGVLFLALWWLVDEALRRIDPERQAMLAAYTRQERLRLELPGVVLWLPMNIALGLIVIGVLPDQEAALYFLAVALLLAVSAMLLVYRQGRPRALPSPVVGRETTP